MMMIMWLIIGGKICMTNLRDMSALTSTLEGNSGFIFCCATIDYFLFVCIVQNKLIILNCFFCSFYFLMIMMDGYYSVSIVQVRICRSISNRYFGQ